MKKRFGMLLALTLVVLMGMTAVAMAETSCNHTYEKGYFDPETNDSICDVCHGNGDPVGHALWFEPDYFSVDSTYHDVVYPCLYGEPEDYHYVGTAREEHTFEQTNGHVEPICRKCGIDANGVQHVHRNNDPCDVCLSLIKCENHVTNKGYFNWDTGETVCDLCHGTGWIAFSSVHESMIAHVPMFSYGKEPNVSYGNAPVIKEVKENYHVASRTCIMYKDIHLVGLIHNFAWNEDHKFVKRDNHKVEICYGCTYVNNGVVVSYGCLVDKYGNIHTDVNCPYCCPNDSCPDGVLLKHGEIMVCNKCGEDADGNEHKITSTTYTYKDENNHTRTPHPCSHRKI